MARKGPDLKDERKAERGGKKPHPRTRSEKSSHEGDPRPDLKTRRQHGLLGGRSGSPPDREEARPRDTGRKGA